MITEAAVTIFRIGLITPVCGWIAGLALGILYSYKLPPSELTSVFRAFRTIEIAGYIRWIFCHRPRTGPVSIVRFALHISAFASFLVNVAFALVAPSWRYAPIVVMLSFAVMLTPAVRWALQIWRTQQPSAESLLRGGRSDG